VEDDSPQLDWHDGVEGREPVAREAGGEAERTLVIACCDPKDRTVNGTFASDCRVTVGRCP